MAESVLGRRFSDGRSRCSARPAEPDDSGRSGPSVAGGVGDDTQTPVDEYDFGKVGDATAHGATSGAVGGAIAAAATGGAALPGVRAARGLREVHMISPKIRIAIALVTAPTNLLGMTVIRAVREDWPAAVTYATSAEAIADACIFAVIMTVLLPLTTRGK